MKHINKNATKVMEKLLSKMNDNHIKIENNKSFMPVNVEIIGHVNGVSGSGRLIAVSHTRIQNGDVIFDPEMVFIEAEIDGEKKYYPASWEMSGMKYEQSIVYDSGNIDGIRPKLQNQHKNFANQWMKNIKTQQHI